MIVVLFILSLWSLVFILAYSFVGAFTSLSSSDVFLVLPKSQLLYLPGKEVVTIYLRWWIYCIVQKVQELCPGGLLCDAIVYSLIFQRTFNTGWLVVFFSPLSIYIILGLRLFLKHLSFALLITFFSLTNNLMEETMRRNTKSLGFVGLSTKKAQQKNS